MKRKKRQKMHRRTYQRNELMNAIRILCLCDIEGRPISKDQIDHICEETLSSFFDPTDSKSIEIFGLCDYLYSENPTAITIDDK